MDYMLTKECKMSKENEAYLPLTEKLEHDTLIMFKTLNFYLTNLLKKNQRRFLL